jgi:hypothetical protein
VTEYSQIDSIVNTTLVRHTKGGTKLSPEMIRLLALVMFEGYELFPGKTMGRRRGDSPHPSRLA